MTKLEALKELLAKVEAGKLDECLYTNCATAIGGAQCERVIDAYRGSLDAAKALHEAVLPGWAVERVTMWPGRNGMCSAHLWGTHDKDGERWHNSVDGRAEAKSDNPARAWFIAIIKALIAMEPEQ